MSSTNKDTMKTGFSDSIKLIIFVALFAISCVGSFIFFKESLWTVVNIIVSIVISLCICGGISLLLPPLDKEGVAPGIGIIAIGILVFSVIKGCFYVSHDKIEERKRLAELQEQARQEQIIADIKKDEQESSVFASSNEEIMTFGTAGNNEIFLSRAKRTIKNFAHDPDSVTDVEAVTPAVRLRMKDYPQCRYAIQVRFRAKNALGAYIRQEAVVLFGKDGQGFKIIDKSIF